MTVVVVKDAEEKALVLTRLFLNEVKKQWCNNEYKFDCTNDRVCDFIEGTFPSVLSMMENYLLSDHVASVTEKEEMIKTKLEKPSYFESRMKSYFRKEIDQHQKQTKEQEATANDEGIAIRFSSDDVFRFTRHTASELVEDCLGLLTLKHNKDTKEAQKNTQSVKEELALFAQDQNEPRSVHEVLHRLRQRANKPSDTNDKIKPFSSL